MVVDIDGLVVKEIRQNGSRLALLVETYPGIRCRRICEMLMEIVIDPIVRDIQLMSSEEGIN